MEYKIHIKQIVPRETVIEADSHEEAELRAIRMIRSGELIDLSCRSSDSDASLWIDRIEELDQQRIWQEEQEMFQEVFRDTLRMREISKKRL